MNGEPISSVWEALRVQVGVGISAYSTISFGHFLVIVYILRNRIIYLFYYWDEKDYKPCWYSNSCRDLHGSIIIFFSIFCNPKKSYNYKICKTENPYSVYKRNSTKIMKKSFFVEDIKLRNWKHNKSYYYKKFELSCFLLFYCRFFCHIL